MLKKCRDKTLTRGNEVENTEETRRGCCWFFSLVIPEDQHDSNSVSLTGQNMIHLTESNNVAEDFICQIFAKLETHMQKLRIPVLIFDRNLSLWVHHRWTKVDQDLDVWVAKRGQSPVQRRLHYARVNIDGLRLIAWKSANIRRNEYTEILGDSDVHNLFVHLDAVLFPAFLWR
jgi:hypothetical protein